MGLHYGVPRARRDRARRKADVRSTHPQILAVDASGPPWRFGVNAQPSDGSEVAFWIVDPSSASILRSSTATPSTFSFTVVNSSPSNYVITVRRTSSQSRTTVSGWQVARDPHGQEKEMAAGPDERRPVNRDSEYSPARTKG